MNALDPDADECVWIAGEHLDHRTRHNGEFVRVSRRAGLRMIVEAHLQLEHRVDARQLEGSKLALTPNLGGASRSNDCSVFLFGVH